MLGPGPKSLVPGTLARSPPAVISGGFTHQRRAIEFGMQLGVIKLLLPGRHRPGLPRPLPITLVSATHSLMKRFDSQNQHQAGHRHRGQHSQRRGQVDERPRRSHAAGAFMRSGMATARRVNCSAQLRSIFVA